jgi:hypothetical protein
MYHCKKCNKIVSDKEVKQFIPVTGKLLHIYEVLENYYKNQSPGKVGWDPVIRTVYCGEVEEILDS